MTAAAIITIVIPVSYTHLDVYKRQRLTIDITNPYESGVAVKEITGLGPVKADISTCLLYTSRCV